MTSAFRPSNRFFVSSDYSVFYRCVRKFHWESQTTSDYALLSVLDGDLKYNAQSTVATLSRNSSLMLEPNTQVSGTTDYCEFLFFTFRSSLLVQHAVTMKLVPPQATVTFPRIPVETGERLNTLFNDFNGELASDRAGKEIVMRAVVEQVLVETLRSFAATKRSDGLEFSRVGLIDRRIRRSVELMHTQLDQDLSLRDLAAASYLSPFHFARLFKKITGATPHNYLAAVRTNRAQLLLANPDLSVSEIGARVGYLSSSHFTKAFRLATGTTPREFRKALISHENS